MTTRCRDHQLVFAGHFRKYSLKLYEKNKQDS